jgi:hypothetical protein
MKVTRHNSRLARATTLGEWNLKNRKFKGNKRYYASKYINITIKTAKGMQDRGLVKKGKCE